MLYAEISQRPVRLLIAILLIAPSTAVFAQQTSSGVTLYGRVDNAVIYQSGRGNGGPQAALSSGAFQPSQFGLKGQEDLGNGMRAVFGLESTIAADTGAQANAARLFDRTAIVGLASKDLGTLTLGRQVTPLAELFYATDPLKAGSGATNLNVRYAYLGGAGTRVASNFGANASIAGNNLDRQDNSIRYNYRSETGFVATTMYAFGESANGNSKNNAAGAMVGYDSGPLTLRGTAMQFHDANGVPFDAFALGAAYQISSTLTAKMTWTKNKILSGITAYGNQTTKIYSAGLSWAAQPNIILTGAFYYGTRGIDAAPTQVARKFYLVPEYKLSNRTSVYALLDLERFNAAGSQLDTGTPLEAGTRRSNYLAIGIGHNF